MKKIYSVLTAAVLGGMVSAYAARPIVAAPSFHAAKEMKVHSISEVNRAEISNLERKYQKTTHKQSRAEGEVNICDYTQMVGYDYFFNVNKPEGGKRAKALGLMSSVGVDIVDNNDNTWTINGYGEYNCSPLFVYEDGVFGIECGTDIGIVSSAYDVSIAAYLYLKNPDGTYKLDENGEIMAEEYLEGIAPFEIYPDALVFDGEIGIAAFDKKSGELLGFFTIYLDNIFYKPNATLSYIQHDTDKDEDGNEIEIEVPINNRVYAQIIEPYEDANPEAQIDEDPEGWLDNFECIGISNIMPDNAGLQVRFAFVDGVGLVAPYQVVYPELLYDSERNIYTDLCHMGFIYYDGAQPYYDDSMMFGNEEEVGISWPSSELMEENFGVVPNSWTVACSYGSSIYTVWGMFDKATLTLDELAGSPDGIKDITSENNANAPKVYYNLQGVQVNQPAAGIYIVKQGNKVTKQVIR